MKGAFYKYLSYFIIIVFLFYWIISIPLAISTSTNKNRLGQAFPKFNRLLGHSWNLFVQSFDYDDRMYLILRNKDTKAITDSIELLGDISYQKSYHVPFNQDEYILDRLVNHYVTLVKHKTVEFSKSIKNNSPGISDSVYKIRFSDKEKTDPAFIGSMGTLNNYCKAVLAKKNIDTANREFKIIIAERRIKPFEQRKDKGYLSKEVIYFESSYNSFAK